MRIIDLLWPYVYIIGMVANQKFISDIKFDSKCWYFVTNKTNFGLQVWKGWKMNFELKMQTWDFFILCSIFEIWPKKFKLSPFLIKKKKSYNPSWDFRGIVTLFLIKVIVFNPKKDKKLTFAIFSKISICNYYFFFLLKFDFWFISMPKMCTLEYIVH